MSLFKEKKKGAIEEVMHFMVLAEEEEMDTK